MAGTGRRAGARYQLGIDDPEFRQSSGNGLLLSFVALIVLGSLAYAAYQYFTPAVSDANGSAVAGLNTPTPAPSVVTPTPDASPETTASPSLVRRAARRRRRRQAQCACNSPLRLRRCGSKSSLMAKRPSDVIATGRVARIRRERRDYFIYRQGSVLEDRHQQAQSGFRQTSV